MRTKIPAVLAVLVLTASACGDDTRTVAGADGTTTTMTSSGPATFTPTTTTGEPDAPAARLAAARARWDDVGPTDYRLMLTELCFCPETVWIETVVDGEVTAHEPGTAEPIFDPGPRSMTDLFEEVEAAIDAGYHTLELEFDPDTGALVRYWVDVEAMMADEEHGVVVEVEPAVAG